MEVEDSGRLEKATFAGGCFWCMVKPFYQWPGVAGVVSGYTGGHLPNPSYEDVCTGTTGHYEAVQVTFDPGQITYGQLLDSFWRQIDPTDAEGQFNDRGTQYRTAIFYHTPAQQAEAEESKRRLEQSGRFERPIVTRILPAETFYPAEDYHQDYYKTHADRYSRYRRGSGRDVFLGKYWPIS